MANKREKPSAGFVSNTSFFIDNSCLCELKYISNTMREDIVAQLHYHWAGYIIFRLKISLSSFHLIILIRSNLHALSTITLKIIQ